MAKHQSLYRWLQKCQNSQTMHIFDGKNPEFPFFEIPVMRYCRKVQRLSYCTWIVSPLCHPKAMDLLTSVPQIYTLFIDWRIIRLHCNLSWGTPGISFLLEPWNCEQFSEELDTAVWKTKPQNLGKSLTSVVNSIWVHPLCELQFSQVSVWFLFPAWPQLLGKTSHDAWWLSNPYSHCP